MESNILAVALDELAGGLELLSLHLCKIEHQCLTCS